jgi:hypothetical protein
MPRQVIRNTEPEHADHEHFTLKKILTRLGGTLTTQLEHTSMHHLVEHIADQLPHDAFFRFRTSTPTTLFDSALDITARTDVWDSVGTFVHNAARSTGTLSVAAAPALTVRQTKKRFHYQPGKSQLGIFTFVFGLRTTGITRRVGLFDGGNGLFFEQTSTGLRFVVRSNTTGIVIDEQYDQGIWNVDPLDGTGPSGIVFDESKAHIFFVQFEWLGVGAIEFGFFYNGYPVICHRISNVNALYGVYMATANLPVRYEIDNDGTGSAADMQQICCTVISEGGVQLNGPLIGIDRGTTALTTLNNASLYPLLAVRLAASAAAIRGNIYVNDVTVTNTSSIIFRWALLFNPTVAGTALTWVANGQISEVAVGATNATTVTGGTLVASGYGVNTAQAKVLAERALPDDALLGGTIAGTRDILVLAVQRLTGTTEPFYGTMNFREQL